MSLPSSTFILIMRSNSASHAVIADVVLCLGTRLNPFSTLPGYGIDYWPKNAKIIQVDADPRVLGLVKPISVGINGDARAANNRP